MEAMVQNLHRRSASGEKMFSVDVPEQTIPDTLVAASWASHWTLNRQHVLWWKCQMSNKRNKQVVVNDFFFFFLNHSFAS